MNLTPDPCTRKMIGSQDHGVIKETPDEGMTRYPIEQETDQKHQKSVTTTSDQIWSTITLMLAPLNW